MFVIFFILIPFSNGCKNYIDMAVSFYEDSHIKSLCLLTCGNENTLIAKHAMSQNLMVSIVNIVDLAEDFSKFDTCVTQRLSMGILLDSKCKAFEKVMYYASKNMIFDSKHTWLIVEDILNTESFNIHSTEDIQDVIYNGKDNNTDNLTCNEDNNIDLSDTSTEYCLASLDNAKINMEYVNVDAEDTSLANNDLRENKIVILLSKMNISVDADITIAKRIDLNTYDFYEIFNYGKRQGGSLVAKKIYGGVRGLKMQNQNYTYYKRWNFNELELKMIVVMSPVPEVFDPQMILGRVRDKRAAMVIQAGAQMLQVIAEIHNIKLIFASVKVLN